MTARPDPAYPLADLALARRLERAEALANVAFVEARRQVDPASGAAWLSVAGTYAMFDGVGSPLTQTFGLGIFDEVGQPELEQLERFFDTRQATAMHEVSPYLPGPTLARLTDRGYRPIEHSTVLVRPAAQPAAPSPDIRAREIRPDEGELWSRTAAEGWSSDSAELAAFTEGLGPVLTRASGTHCFLAEAGGRPVAAAALSIHGDVALLAGASTLPKERGKGAQRALLEARLRYAATHGAALAMIVAQPGSGSQRNAEREGFRVAYTRTKWHLPRRS
jgi:GNAT superfamily N-acetyltransferase